MYNREERDTFAYFPETMRKTMFGTMFDCYSLIGEHSSCDKGYIQESGEEVNEERASKLIKALREIYSDIEII